MEVDKSLNNQSSAALLSNPSLTTESRVHHGNQRKVPLSVDELLKLKKDQESKESKPSYLSKAQRREAALKARQAEVEQQRNQMSNTATSTNSSQPHSLSNLLALASQETRRSNSPPQHDTNEYFDKEMIDNEERKRELDIIKREKLGLVVQEKRKITRYLERAAPRVTHWDDSEDTTTKDYSELFKRRSEYEPQVSKGAVSMDYEEQQDNSNRPSSSNATSSSQHDYRSNQRGRNDHHPSNHQSHRPSSSHQPPKLVKNEFGQLVRAESSHHMSTHWSKKPLDEMNSRDWRIFKEDFRISAKGKDIPNPIRNWREANLPDWTNRAIRDAGYDHPTAIQMQSIPIGMQGRDLIGIAQTGSGKTAAFLIPLLNHISKLPRLFNTKEAADGPYACILAPTRELAMQIKEEADKFAKYANCKAVLIIGGEDIQPQAAELRKGCEIIVATTGRLVDLLNNALIVLNQCHYIVLDEGDRMIDMGFEEQLLQILDAMPQSQLKSDNPEEAARQEKLIASNERDPTSIFRTTVLFSATMPTAVERIAAKYLRNPATITIGEAGSAVDSIKQVVEWMKNDSEKRRRLEFLLRSGPRPPIIIFCNQKATCDSLAKYIQRFDLIPVVLHSGKAQDQRSWAIQEFKRGDADVLIATNVAGRGLDVRGVTHVINYDLPESIEEYTHRIGRTGRAGMNGLATSFLTQNDDKILLPLRQMLIKTKNHVPSELRDRADIGLRPVM